jgi:TDG/mug DNA glycosylase family protein
MIKQNKKIIRSFSPYIDKNSKILILGTMPGPEALRRQEYYGFPGNHFWKILFQLFGVDRPLTYPQKKKLLKEKGIALWDVFESCERIGALDSAIRCAKHTDIQGLLKKYPNIRAVFPDCRTAEKVYAKQHAPHIKLPYFRLPSPSPAYASMPLAKKVEAWSVILKYL